MAQRGTKNKRVINYDPFYYTINYANLLTINVIR